MLTTPQPQLLWKKACVIKPSKCDLSASMVGTGEERKPMLGHPEVGVKENAQISTTRGGRGLSDVLNQVGGYKHTQLQG